MANLSNINGKFVVEQTTGYVGVGTTDPNYPIEVLNASAEIALNASGGSIYRVQSDSASNFIIRKEGVGDRLVINSAGNVNIGSSLSAEKLEVGGTIRIRVPNTSSATLLLNNTDTQLSIDNTGGNMIFTTAGAAERIRIDSSGNFGFNVVPQNSSATWRNFQVGGGNMVTRASGGNGVLLGTGYIFTSADTELYKNTAAVSRMYFNNDEIRFQNAASGTAGTAISWSERMRIDSSGFVTIKNTPNTTGASLTLQNQTEISVNETVGYLNFSSTDTSTSSSGGVGGIGVYGEEAFNTSYTPTYMSFYTHERTNNDGTVRGNVTERMRIDSSGNVTVYNDFTIDNSSPEFYMTTGSTHHNWRVAAQEVVNEGFEIASQPAAGGAYTNHLVILGTSGNVGIGTTSPQTKLDVHGPTGTRNRSTTGNSSVFETSLYWGANGNTTTNVSIDTATVFPPMGSSGFILVEVSASGYGNSGSNGLIFSYITGGYGGHYAAVNQPYHPVTIITNTMMAGTCTWYNPSSGIIGITVTTTNSQGITGVMRVKVTTSY